LRRFAGDGTLAAGGLSRFFVGKIVNAVVCDDKLLRLSDLEGLIGLVPDAICALVSNTDVPRGCFEDVAL
jgi:hypothetical protein